MASSRAAKQESKGGGCLGRKISVDLDSCVVFYCVPIWLVRLFLFLVVET